MQRMNEREKRVTAQVLTSFFGLVIGGALGFLASNNADHASGDSTMSHVANFIHANYLIGAYAAGGLAVGCCVGAYTQGLLMTRPNNFHLGGAPLVQIPPDLRAEVWAHALNV